MVRLDRITMQGFKSFAGRITIPLPVGFNCIAGPNGSGKSCRGDTEVLLATGEIKPIKEIVESALAKAELHVKLDDGVFTYENPDKIEVLGLDVDGMKIVEKSVSAFVKREGEKELYKITTKTGRSATTTGCHPVMVYRGGKIVPEVIENLKQGDLIAAPRKLSLPENETQIDGIEVDEDFARFIGYLIGDGYVTSNRLEIVNAENNIIEDFENLADKFKLKIKYKKKSGKATRLVAWDNNFPLLMKRLLRSDSILHLTSKYKIIPPEIMFSKKSVIANFLAGLFDCDATIRKDNPTFEYTTKNEKLANQVQLSLLRFRIVARKEKKFKHATNTRLRKRIPYFYVIVEGKEKLLQLYENIPMQSKLKIGRLKKFALRNVKSGSNIDVLPQEVNRLVHDCTKLLGVKIKSLRKKYPWFAAYNENRCCPTRKGINNALAIFREKYINLESCAKNLTAEKLCLLKALNSLNIKRRHASIRIGLSKDTINNSWVAQNFGGKKKNLENLYNYVKNELVSRLKKSKNIIQTLENLASSDIFWDRIEKIEKVEGEKWVYDLTIPNCHNFIGNGIFVHNSNIIDAITFVLGTTSARVIRAQKLQNLLFNGAKDKKPADFCEVSIYLDNSGGKIPGEKEIKITRRITRSGLSVYKLNGRTVTRAKILDLLSYANLSSEGYNIIMQGDVTRIIEMSSEERREFIDEISGIAEFDEKKEKANKELEHVELRVRENMIVVAEKQKLIMRLKHEKESAEKYQELDRDLRKSKASLYKLRLSDSQAKFGALNKEIDEMSKNFEGSEKEFQKIEADIELKEKSIKNISNEIIGRSRNYEILKKMDSINTEIVRKKDRLDFYGRESERLRNVAGKNIIDEINKLDNPGIYGTIADLIDVPKRYDVALEVALGQHAKDIVVKDDDIATLCIKFLKEKKLGRARFIPLNKIKPKKRKNYEGREKIIGYAIDLIKFDKKYDKAISYVLENTLIVDDIDIAKNISDFRVVTLDGDLVEISGAMIGGFYRKRYAAAYTNEIKKLYEEKRQLEKDVEKLENELEKLKSQEKEETEDVKKLQRSMDEEDKLLEQMRKRRRELYDERLVLTNKIGKDKIERARYEANIDSLKQDYGDYKDVKEFYNLSQDEIQEKIRSDLIEINRIGPVNLRAIEEFQTMNIEFEELKKKLDKLLEEKEAIVKIVQEIEQKRYSKFMETFSSIALNFSKIYHDLTDGGIGHLRLETENNIDSGLIIEASPVGKRVLNLDAMSGGEKTLTSLAFLFAIMQHSASPFYILDEIDAALDKANTKKIANLIRNYSKDVQFVVITHNDITIADADKVFGVSMEDGISKVFGIEMPAV